MRVRSLVSLATASCGESLRCQEWIVRKCALLISEHPWYLKVCLLLHAILPIILKRDVSRQIL